MGLIHVVMVALLVSQSSAIFDWITDPISTIGKFVKDVILGTGQVIKSIVDSAGNTLNVVVDEAGNVIRVGVDAAGNVIKAGARVIGQVFDSSVNVICAVGGDLIPCKESPENKPAPLPIQCRGSADIILVVDASGSIGDSNFKKVLSFIANLALSYKLGPNDIRMGLVSFSDNAEKRIDLKDYNNGLDLAKALLGTPYSKGSTATDKALDLIRNSNLFGQLAGGRFSVPDIVIVITDGMSNNPLNTALAAERLKSAGVTVFSVGVKDADRSELVSIASGLEYVFRAGDFDIVENVLYQLVQRTCAVAKGYQQPVVVEEVYAEKEKACTSKSDIITVIDSSGSIGVDNFKKLLKFIDDLLKNFKIGKSDVLVGNVVYSHLAQKMFDLKDNPSDVALSRALSATPYLKYNTRTDLALKLILEDQMFSSLVGGRPDAKKIAIVFTDGISDQPSATKAAAAQLKDQGVLLISVGIGSATRDSELQDIASGPQYVLKAASFDALSQIEKSITQRTCQGANKK